MTSDELRWAAADAELRLVTSAQAPVLIAGFGGDGGQPTPLVELSLDATGHRAPSTWSRHRYADSAGLRYAGHEQRRIDGGDELRVTQRDPSGLDVCSVLARYGSHPAIRVHTEVRNTGATPRRLRYVSSLNLTGFCSDRSLDSLRIGYANNSWVTEHRWQEFAPRTLGLVQPRPHPSPDAARQSFGLTAQGSWSTDTYLPMGAVTDLATGRSWVWQIEHNGPWHWELSEAGGDLLLSASGPSEPDHLATQLLAPGEAVSSVPVAIVLGTGGLESALAALTGYRRAIRRPNADNETLPVIFNDYMNCLVGDPTTEKLLPLIVAAAEVGSEYFVIDAGWYADDADWWPTVGEWRPSARRFPGGLSEVMERIRAAGMVPGLWLEPEVVGVDSPVAGQLPDEAFFCRDGKRVLESGRYQLDYRHRSVIDRMNAVIDGLVADFGVGYFKFDYNVNIGVGTDVGEIAPGAGLLGHNRAYCAWLDSLFDKYPDLVIENCSSGGMRADYAQLARLSVHSTSDQEDPVAYAPIAAAAPIAVTPEQGAVWSYPQPDWDDERNALTLVSSMLGRVHLSGRIDQLAPHSLRVVAEAVGCYQRLRGEIPTATPVWPLGLPGWSDEWISLGLRCANADLMLIVWRRGGEPECTLPLPEYAGSVVEVLFPLELPAPGLRWDSGTLRVGLPACPAARLLRIRSR